MIEKKLVSLTDQTLFSVSKMHETLDSDNEGCREEKNNWCTVIAFQSIELSSKHIFENKNIICLFNKKSLIIC